MMSTSIQAILVAITSALLTDCGFPQEEILGSWESTEIQDFTGGMWPPAFTDEPYIVTNRTDYWTFDSSNILIESISDGATNGFTQRYRLKNNSLIITESKYRTDNAHIKINRKQGTMIIDHRPYGLWRLRRLSHLRIGTNSIQQGGPAYPPQGVGSADP